MPSLPLPWRRVGRLLVGHVRRLQLLLEALAGQVRAAIARAIGQVTGEAVRDAIRVILDAPHACAPGPGPPEDREGLWGEPRRRYWPDQPYRAYGAYDEPDREPAYGYDPPDEDEPVQRGPAEAESAGRWSRAAAAGCSAAAWFLHRHPGKLSLIAAVGVGVLAGAVALVGGPFIAGGSAVALSAFGILALADAAQAAAGLASAAVS
jgi:hypothetical protein